MATWGAALFTAVLLDVLLDGPLRRLDHRLLTHVHPVQDTPLTVTAEVLAAAGHWSVQGGVLLAVTALVAVRRRSVRPLAVATLALLLVGALGVLGKQAFGRTAPRSGFDELFAGSAAFPSGHAAGALVVGVLLVDLLDRRSGSPARRWLLAGAGVWWLAMGWSRVHLYVHWATDVLAGWALGLFVLGTVWWADALVPHFGAHPQRSGKSADGVDQPRVCRH